MKKKLLISFVFMASLILGTSFAMAKDLTVGLKGEPTSLDPHFHNVTQNNQMALWVFDKLILQDSRQKMYPGLAESWKPISDTVWEFKLRQGVKFHDGSPFTAEDVKFTFERIPNVPNSPSSFTGARERDHQGRDNRSLHRAFSYRKACAVDSAQLRFFHHRVQEGN